MVGPVDYQNDLNFWCMDKWTRSFPVTWHIIRNIHNSNFQNILVQNNEYKPVTSSRDTQEKLSLAFH
jgi:YTH domain-containing family protein